MIYGALFMSIICLVLGKDFEVEWSLEYGLSLGYLVVLGSVIAFGVYLTLVSKIGAGKAGYSLMIIPVISILISSFFEDYEINSYTLSGVFLIMFGNVLALRNNTA